MAAAAAATTPDEAESCDAAEKLAAWAHPSLQLPGVARAETSDHPLLLGASPGTTGTMSVYFALKRLGVSAVHYTRQFNATSGLETTTYADTPPGGPVPLLKPLFGDTHPAPPVDLEAARAEIVRVRKICKDFARRGSAIIDAAPSKDDPRDKVRREDVIGDRVNVDLANYTKTVVPKTNDQRGMIIDALNQNVLFKNMPADELGDMVDAFFEKKYTAGETIIQQGDAGDNLYVLETGQLPLDMRHTEGAVILLAFRQFRHS